MPSLGKVLDVYGYNYAVDASVVLYRPNNPASNNQMWLIESNGEAFAIKSAGAPSLALALGVDGKTISLAEFNANEKKQQWFINY